MYVYDYILNKMWNYNDLYGYIILIHFVWDVAQDENTESKEIDFFATVLFRWL